jgi:hypothetical protein
VSPSGLRTYCFDIDETICTNTAGDYASVKPHESLIDHVNALYAAGQVISFFTARGSTGGL